MPGDRTTWPPQASTPLSDGRVLIAGGSRAAWNDRGPFLASAELYDPTTGTFSATDTLTDGRAHDAATLLSDGRILISGGVADSGATSLASAGIHDPTTGTFTGTGPMTDGRDYQTATLLDNGRVLIAAGLPSGRDYANNPRFLASPELYDPTRHVQPTDSMAGTRTYHGAALLRDGRVRIICGVTEKWRPTGSPEPENEARGQLRAGLRQAVRPGRRE